MHKLATTQRMWNSKQTVIDEEDPLVRAKIECFSLVWEIKLRPSQREYPLVSRPGSVLSPIIHRIGQTPRIGKD